MKRGAGSVTGPDRDHPHIMTAFMGMRSRRLPIGATWAGYRSRWIMALLPAYKDRVPAKTGTLKRVGGYAGFVERRGAGNPSACSSISSFPAGRANRGLFSVSEKSHDP